METRVIGLEQFHELILPAITDPVREIIGEFDVIAGTHPALGKMSAIQGAISDAVLITAER